MCHTEFIEVLLPNRHGSVDSYRYGFQGQEKDDEIKGEGNSINYKFRMHDPRLGRFFAVDPLAPKYPWFSPYQFSGNRVLDAIELEGLENSFELRFNRRNVSYIKGDISQKELMDEYKAEAIGAVIGSTIVADFYIGKGKITEFAFKQFGFQLAVNASVEDFLYVAIPEYKFEPKKVVRDAFTGFDIAATGIDQSIKLIGNKYKLGKIQKVLEVIAPSLFDITIKDGIQMARLNKDSSKIIEDIIGNTLSTKTESLLKNYNIELPKIKLSTALEAKIISDFITKSIKVELEKISNQKIKKDSNDIREKSEKKNDAIPNTEVNRKEVKLKDS